MYADKFLVPSSDGMIKGSKKPYLWIFDGSSIANEENTFRWDTNGEPKLYGALILWNAINKHNQSFSIEPNGDVVAFGGFPLTVKNNRVVFGKETDINIKVKLKAPPSPSIKFVSYNILTGLPYFENDFSPTLKKKFCAWGLGREELVKTEVLKADIAVLVECTNAQLADILQGTTKFEAHLALKIHESDGTAILFNKSRFVFVKKMKEQLSAQGGQIVFNVVLRDRQTDKMLCVTGLHLKSGDELSKEKRRLIELKSALEITDRYIAEYAGNISQVLSGDLNSDAYRYATVVSLLTQNGYTDIGDNRPTYYFWQKSIYDYIFIRGAIEADSYDVDHVQSKCPNAQQGSDHLAVRCNLVLH